MTPLERKVAWAIAPWKGEEPESATAWAEMFPGTPAAMARAVERVGRLVDLVRDERAEAYAEARRSELALEGVTTDPDFRPRAFVLDREPIPKPRPRTFLIGGKPRIHPDSDGEKDEIAIDLMARRHAPPKPWEGPVFLVVEARLAAPAWKSDKWKRPAALARAHEPIERGTGDADNYLKQLQDALSRENRWWLDDSQVTGSVARKAYAATSSWHVEVYFREPMTAAKWVEQGGLFAQAAARA